MAQPDMTFYQKAIGQVLGKPVRVQHWEYMAGGCINNAVKVQTDCGTFFLKWHAAFSDDMFEKEAGGLHLLARTKQLKIPVVHGFGYLDGRHFLVLEYIQSARKQTDYWEKFGAALALLHRDNTAKQYGLHEDNYIGRLEQPNGFYDDWIEFFIKNRLEHQLQLAVNNGLVTGGFISRYRKFYEKLSQLLPADRPTLLHGDLWSCNVMTGTDGYVCLIDPAVYYGNREIELAFTQMFGGFSERFYEAYSEAWPLEPGYDDRADIYNIYPSMVHANLFGPSYLMSVETVLRRCLG